MKDTHLIYLILTCTFNEFDKKKLLKKIYELSNRSDEEIKEFLSNIRGDLYGFPYNETKVPDTKVSSFKIEDKKSKSELIRERLEYFLSEKNEFKIRELSREFNSSPSLIEKCLKIVLKKHTNLTIISKRERYGSVSFKIISLNYGMLSQKQHPIVRLESEGLEGEHSNKGKDFSPHSPSTIFQGKHLNGEHLNNSEHFSPHSPSTILKGEYSYTSLLLTISEGEHLSRVEDLNKDAHYKNNEQVRRQIKETKHGEHLNKGKHLDGGYPIKGEHFSTPSQSTISQSEYLDGEHPIKGEHFSPHSKSTILQGKHLDGEHLNKGKHLFSLSQPTTPKGEHSFKGKHLKKEKEKVSYNLLKEIEKNKEKNSIEKIINNFLSFQEIENLDLFKYHKEILKIYLKYGGKIQEKDVKYGKGILTFATPKQFEAILLKVIREKKGEIPRIQYLYEVARRMNLKWKKKKENPKLFERRKENYIYGENEVTCEVSFRGKTGDEAMREFFGEEVYQNMLKEREEEKRLKEMEEEKRLKEMEEEKRLNPSVSLTLNNCKVKELEEEKKLKERDEEKIVKEIGKEMILKPSNSLALKSEIKEMIEEKRLNSNTSFSLKYEKKEIEEEKMPPNTLDSRFLGNDKRNKNDISNISDTSLTLECDKTEKEKIVNTLDSRFRGNDINRNDISNISDTSLTLESDKKEEEKIPNSINSITLKYEVKEREKGLKQMEKKKILNSITSLNLEGEKKEEKMLNSNISLNLESEKEKKENVLNTLDPRFRGNDNQVRSANKARIDKLDGNNKLDSRFHGNDINRNNISNISDTSLTLECDKTEEEKILNSINPIALKCEAKEEKVGLKQIEEEKILNSITSLNLEGEKKREMMLNSNISLNLESEKEKKENVLNTLDSRFRGNDKQNKNDIEGLSSISWVIDSRFRGNDKRNKNDISNPSLALKCEVEEIEERLNGGN